MKKIYAVTAALAMAAAASAAVMPQATKQLQQAKDLSNAECIAEKANTASELTRAGMEDIYGMYHMYGMWGLEGAPERTYFQWVLSFTPGANAGEVNIRGLQDWNADPIVAKVDLNAGTITIPSNVFLGKYTYGGYNDDVVFLNFNAAQSGIADAGPVTVDLMMDQDGNIMFEYPSDRGMATWIPTVNGGFGVIYGAPTFSQMPKLQTAGWESLGKGKITEGWVSPLLIYNGVMTEAQTTYQVEIQKSTTEPGVYRVLNPYGANTPFGPYNEYNVGDFALEFNATVPECVLMPTYHETVLGQWNDGSEVIVAEINYAGFFDGSQGIAPGNVSGIYYIEGFSQEDIIDEDLNETVLENGIVTINDPVFACSGVFRTDAGYQAGAKTMFGSWGDGAEVMPCVIDMSDLGAVDALEMDENAPKQYFNLQGVRVVAPEAGELVIVRQGSKAKKVVVK